MPPAIVSISTQTPAICIPQQEAADWLAQSFGVRKRPARILRMLHHYSGIETRYTCNDHYLQPPEQSPFAPGIDPVCSARTSQRMAIYEQQSVPLGTEAAQQAVDQFAQTTGITANEVQDSITHLVAVSCTGLFAPGLDYALTRALGLSMGVHRSLIGFMGCAAMFNALKVAHDIVKSQPNARVLVVSVELCSLHLQPSEAYDDLTGASIFADGASACIVSADEVPGRFEIEQFHTSVLPDSEQDMAWRIGDHGFVLRLSPRIPELVPAATIEALPHLFPNRAPQFWAIHPGGKAILDRLQDCFSLNPEELEASRLTLRDFGNMSSATILFVLDAIRQQQRSGSQGVAMAFGPGLTVEMMRLTYA